MIDTAHDALFEILAQSSIASSLQELELLGTRMTDATASCWRSFSALKRLKIELQHLCRASYREIGQLGSLTSVEASFEDAAVVEDKDMPLSALEEILSQAKSLREISFRSSALTEEAAVFQNCLKKNQQLARSLQRVRCRSVRQIGEFLIHLCPQLRDIDEMTIEWRLLVRLAPHMNNFETLRISLRKATTLNNYEQAAIDWIGSKFSNLTALNLINLPSDGPPATFEATSLLCLSQLKQLQVKVESWNCFSFPATLTDLRITIDAPGVFSFEPFLACLRSDLMQLRTLFLRVPVGPPRVYQAILEALPNLEAVKFGSLIREREGSLPPLSPLGLTLSHPKIRTIELAGAVKTRCGLVLRDFPSLTTCSLEEETVQIVSNRPLYLEEVQAHSSGAAHLSSLATLPSLTAFSARIHIPDVLNISCLLRNLVSLRLSLLASPTEGLSAITSNLRLLRDLHLLFNDGCQDPSFDWLKHDRLQHFTFRTHHRVSFSPPAAPIRVSHLPSLRTCCLIVPEVPSLEYIFEELLSLHNLRFITRSAGTDELAPTDVSLRIFNCTSLAFVSVSSIPLSKLVLHNLPHLVVFALSACSPPLQSFSIVAPSLQFYNISENSNCSDLAAIITAQAPAAVAVCVV